MTQIVRFVMTLGFSLLFNCRDVLEEREGAGGGVLNTFMFYVLTSVLCKNTKKKIVATPLSLEVSVQVTIDPQREIINLCNQIPLVEDLVINLNAFNNHFLVKSITLLFLRMSVKLLE